jgi:hypothetical protein
MFGIAMLTAAAVAAAVIGFGGWLMGLLALVIVSKREFDVRHPRMAARLDRAVWTLWITGAAVMFGPAFGLGMAALFVE